MTATRLRAQSTIQRKRHTPDEIRILLEKVAMAAADGKSVIEACNGLGISEASYYRWRVEIGGGTRLDPAAERERTYNKIITAAKEIFLQEGRAVKLDAVAKHAQVTRQTLYNLFGSKEQLFRVVVNSIYERILDPIIHVDNKGDIRATMLEYGRQIITAALDRESLALMRLTLAEHYDFPDLGAILYNTTSQHAPVLVAFFQAQIEAGRLCPFDSQLAAESFVGGLTSHSRYRALVGVGFEPMDRREATLEFMVDTFIKGLSP